MGGSNKDSHRGRGPRRKCIAKSPPNLFMGKLSNKEKAIRNKKKPPTEGGDRATS